MPLTAHLAELRNRLIWIILAIAVGGSIGFAFGEPIISVLRGALPPDVRLIQLELGDGFSIRLQISFVVGVILGDAGDPVALLAVHRAGPHRRRARVDPAVDPDGARSSLPSVSQSPSSSCHGRPSSCCSSFREAVDRTINIRSYFEFMSSLFLGSGILMEYPILLVALSESAIVTSERLRHLAAWRSSGSFAFSAVAPRAETSSARHPHGGAVPAVRGHDPVHPADGPLIRARGICRMGELERIRRRRSPGESSRRAREGRARARTWSS